MLNRKLGGEVLLARAAAEQLGVGDERASVADWVTKSSLYVPG